jgi:hypothetical protein
MTRAAISYRFTCHPFWGSARGDVICDRGHPRAVATLEQDLDGGGGLVAVAAGEVLWPRTAGRCSRTRAASVWLGHTVVSVNGSDAHDGIPAELAGELARLQAENARLLRLLKLTRREAAPPGPAQAGFFEAPPGTVHAGSPPELKVALFGALFAARTDIYAVSWQNARTGQKGWLAAVRGGWRKGARHEERDYLPLTAEVLAAHLSGQMHVGLYPLLDGDRCWWLAADFDGTAAMLDALNYVKAARALGVPAGLEVSRSGIGAHAWTFFTAAVPAETARRLGAGLLREAMALRGQMSLASYDRLFPSQDRCTARHAATARQSSSILPRSSRTTTSGSTSPRSAGSRPVRRQARPGGQGKSP